MFNDCYGLTKEVFEGRKTQTRRIIPESALAKMPAFQEKFFNDTLDLLEERDLLIQYFLVDKYGDTRYSAGETIAIAMPYKDIVFYKPTMSEKTLNLIHIRVEPDDSIKKSPGWTNKMFVKPELMPEHIRITGIRIERLQDISDEDCLKEGIKKSWWMGASGKPLYGFGEHDDRDTSPREAYAALIDKISGKGAWEKNPWVFVYDFELVK